MLLGEVYLSLFEMVEYSTLDGESPVVESIVTVYALTRVA